MGQVKQILNIIDDSDIGFKNPQRGRVYDPAGACPTLTCCSGGNLEPKIVLPAINGYHLFEGGGLYTDQSKAFFHGSLPGASRTLKAEMHDSGVFLADNDKLDDLDMELVDKIKQLKNGEIEFEDLTKEEIKEAFEKKYLRIRKLTPRECFRLMDVREEDIDTIQRSGVSNSSQYKLAGNSIVEACLYAIFKNILAPEKIEYRCGDQLSLF